MIPIRVAVEKSQTDQSAWAKISKGWTRPFLPILLSQRKSSPWTPKNKFLGESHDYGIQKMVLRLFCGIGHWPGIPWHF